MIPKKGIFLRLKPPWDQQFSIAKALQRQLDAIISNQQCIQAWFAYSLLLSLCAIELSRRTDDLHCSSTIWAVFKSSRHQSQLPPCTYYLPPTIIPHTYHRLLELKLFICEQKHIQATNKMYQTDFWMQRHIGIVFECSAADCVYAVIDTILSVDCTSKWKEVTDVYLSTGSFSPDNLCSRSPSLHFKLNWNLYSPHFFL